MKQRIEMEMSGSHSVGGVFVRKETVCECVGCQGFSSITDHTVCIKQSLLGVSDVIFTTVTKIW